MYNIYIYMYVSYLIIYICIIYICIIYICIIYIYTYIHTFIYIYIYTNHWEIPATLQLLLFKATIGVFGLDPESGAVGMLQKKRQPCWLIGGVPGLLYGLW